MVFFLSIVLSMNYLVLDIDSNNLQEDLFRIFLNRLDTLFSGYGIVWSLVLIGIFFGFVNAAGLSIYYMDGLPLWSIGKKQ